MSQISPTTTSVETNRLPLEATCCICLEPVILNTRTITLECNHQYHYRCFQRYLNSQEDTVNCPYCRRNLEDIQSNDTESTVIDPNIQFSVSIPFSVPSSELIRYIDHTQVYGNTISAISATTDIYGRTNGIRPFFFT